jgi:hypothetical protein
MKMLLRCLLVVLLSNTLVLQAQRKPRIKGNRDVVEVTESLPPFSRLELIDDLEIILRRSAEESFSITADDNLIDVIKFRVTDGTLVISSFYEITAKKELSIVVSYSQLNEITASDGRVITGEGGKLNTDILNVKATGKSHLILDGDIGQLFMEMQDNSKGEYTMTADSLSVNLQHRSETQLYVNAFSGSLAVSDNAILRVEGTSGAADLEVKRNGKVRAEDFNVGSLTARLTGSSDTRIFAREQLEISLSGSARCYLFGEPVISLATFKDSAEFFKRNK